jgi:transglutaminase-like putative cysteine protease
MVEDRARMTEVALGLLVILALTASLGLLATDWADDLEIIPALALVGVVAGAALAFSRFSAPLAALFATAYGIFALGFQLGRTLDPAIPWRARLFDLGGRIVFFGARFYHGEANEDTLMFVMLMGILYWGLAIISAWGLIRRRSYWWAILPLGLTLVLQTYFYVGKRDVDLYLAFYLLVALLLAVWMELGKRWESWIAIRAHVPPEVNYRLVTTGLIAALLLVGVAWAGPSLAYSQGFSRFWAQLTRPWNPARDRLESVVTNLRGGRIVQVSEFYGDELTLEAGEEAGTDVVMEVTPLSESMPPARIYWRSRTYNTYENGAWTRVPDFEKVLDPGEGDFPLPALQGRQLFEVRIAPISSAQRLLSVPPQPIWVSRTSNARVMEQGGDLVDISALYADRVVMLGETYQARSMVSTPTARDLRDAGDSYPDWVIDHYLQIPASVTGRTRDLAVEITSGYDNAYDKVAAITSWLRSNIDYQRVTEAPPPGQDPIDWILFDYQIGFCNYYASAEVIMLRSLGIPARLAVGFAQGVFQEVETGLAPEPDEVMNVPQGVFVVRDEDAHAWPEVYFPDYGWVEFEPTVSQAPLLRPEDEAEAREFADTFGGAMAPGRGRLDRLSRDTDTPEDASDETNAELGGSSFGWLGAVAMVSLSLIGLAFGWTRLDIRWRLKAMATVSKGMRRVGVEPPRLITQMQQAPVTPTGQIYSRWSRWLPRMGVELSPSQTPQERALLFEQQLPEERRAGWAIVDAYNRERFGQQAVDVRLIKGIWWDLRFRLWRAWARRLMDLFINGDRARQRSLDPRLRLGRVSETQPQSYGAD